MAPFQSLETAQKLDLRAQTRTYDGSYTRYAISTWILSILITRFFSVEFIPIAIVYLVFGSLVFLISIWRSFVVRQGRVDMDIDHSLNADRADERRNNGEDARVEGARVDEGVDERYNDEVSSGKILWFRTSGDVVLLVSVVCMASYSAILVLILKVS